MSYLTRLVALLLLGWLVLIGCTPIRPTSTIPAGANAAATPQLTPAAPLTATAPMTTTAVVTTTDIVTTTGASSGQLANGVRYRNLAVHLDGAFTSTAQLTFPPTGEGPWPTVILFAGSGPYDLDARYSPAPSQPVVSTNFRTIAEQLGAMDIAVLRFNKRGVLRYGQHDMAQVQPPNVNQLLADAEAVLTAAQAQPEVDTHRLYLYGWSEGAQVAANVAMNHPELAGLILQAPPNGGLEETLRYQQMDVALPYLRTTVDQNGDGQLSRAELETIPPGPVWYTAALYIWTPASAPDHPTLQPALDANGDGAIDIEQELAPAIEQQIPTLAKSYAANAPSATTADLVAQLTMPVLILHGRRDGWVSSRNADLIAAAAPETASVIVYPNLGHALSSTKEPATDAFGQMVSWPIEDTVKWITEIAAPPAE